MPAWHMRGIAELSGSTLQWSMVVESHTKKHNTWSNKPCVFCSKTYGSRSTSNQASKAPIHASQKQSGLLTMECAEGALRSL